MVILENRLVSELLSYLMLNNEVMYEDLLLKCDLEESVAKDLIHKINITFKKEIIIINEKSIYMSEKCKVLCYKKYFQGKQQLFTFYDVELRQHLLLMELIVGESTPSLQDLADVCQVSKNTILKDTKTIKSYLRQKGLDLNYSRKKGYFILGSEFIIRNLLVSLTKQMLRLPGGRILLVEKDLINDEEIFLLRKRLESVEARIGIQLTDEKLDELPYVLQLVIKRAHKSNRKWSFKIEKYDIKNTVEFPEIKQMFWDDDSLSETDLLYLSLQVLASNMVESALQISDGDEISMATDHFIDQIESSLALKISRRSELKEKLMLHMRPAIYRNLLGFQINNPLTDEFIEEYPDIYHVVLKSVGPFEKIIHQKLSRQEVVYLSMIILGWLYQTEETETIFKGVVLCQSGTSISKLLLVTLQSMFPEIDFIGAYSVRQFEQERREVDFIFTTIPLKSSTTTFLIPAILDKQSRIDLKRQVNSKMRGDSYLMAEKLVDSLSPYISIKYKDDVFQIIEKFFKSRNLDVGDHFQAKEEQFVFSINHITITEDIVSWENIVDFSMYPLLKRNSVTEAYIQKTKEAFYDSYQTMIIAPNVFLPHAHPDHGAKRMDFQFVIFKNPIYTPTNEKVHIVVALAPSDEHKHVPTLIKLNNFLIDSKSVRKIVHAPNAFAIKTLLNQG